VAVAVETDGLAGACLIVEVGPRPVSSLSTVAWREGQRRDRWGVRFSSGAVDREVSPMPLCGCERVQGVHHLTGGGPLIRILGQAGGGLGA
jgi:hypothetical protein